MNGKLLMVSLLCFMLSNIHNCTGKKFRVPRCEERLRDFVCGWELEEPQCPPGYGCWRINATGEKVCCPYDEVEFGWRRKIRSSRRNENKKDNGKTEFRHVIEYN